MPHINLLPWREERREENQRQFFNVIGGCLLIAAGIAFLAVKFVNGLIDEQDNRNAFLEKEIVFLNGQNKKIDTLEKDHTQLLAGIQAIQQLQAGRSKTVRVLDAIARAVPDGVHLEEVVRSGELITFNGVAQSNALVALLMTQLDENQEFTGGVSLDVVMHVSDSDNANEKFTLSVKESTLKSGGGEK